LGFTGTLASEPKSAVDELAPILTQLYQYSLAEGEIPSDWRDAHIVPVFKKGDKHPPSNYRNEDIQASVVPSTP
jgi:hypothetical protein